MSDKIESLPKLGLLPLSAEDGVRQLISQFGKEAVLAAVKVVTKAKRGRKAEKDWPLLRPYLERDAADWLEGRDPLQLRSSYAIANAVAAENPGHNQTATATRILKKLSAKRRWFFLADAWQRSDSGYPHGVHLRTLRALAKHDESFGSLLGYNQADVERYRERFGEPSAEMTMAEIKEANRNALMQFAKPPPNTLGNLGGMFAGRTPKP